ncbi:MAG: MMPL family transporter [Marmoricola sp.]
MDRLADLVTRRARLVLAAGLLVAIAAGLYGLVVGGGVLGRLQQGGFDDPASASARELARERAVFGNEGVDLVAIYRDDRHAVGDPAFRREVRRVLDRVPAGTTARVVTSWGSRDTALVSRDGHATQVLVSLRGADQAATSDIDDRVLPALENTAGTDLHAQVAGPWAVYRGVNETVGHDLARAEALSTPLVIVLSLLVFGSVVAAFMPGIVGGLAVLGALAVVRLITTGTDGSVFALNVNTLLGMGLAIDYALFVISRFREELAARDPRDRTAPVAAVRAALATAGRTVLFSALTVAAALSSLLVFPQNFLRSLAYGGIAAVVVAAAAALTVLPALLGVLGHRVDAGRLRRRRSAEATRHVAGEGAWARLARTVMRRPVVTVTAVVAVLAVLAVPFLGVRWGSVDYRVLPPDAPAHRAAATLARDFGGERSTADVLVPSADGAVVDSYVTRLRGVDGVAVQRVDATADHGGVTLLRASWAGDSQSGHSQDVVRALRGVPAPDGTLVGGLSAATVDLGASLGAHLPVMAAIIVAVMLVLLFLAFGSVVLPLKAVVMNLLSLGASFGVVTWIFADGHLEHLLGYTSTGLLDMTQPIFMLAILVGLSMDYEVFLLSRIREQWDATRDSVADPSERNRLAVAAGLQRTGRIITSAALLLGVVVGAFATSGVVFMKMIGLGMLVALLVDATVVRALLVPATMRLLGRWNWWAPAPLARFWERYGVREEAVQPAPAATRVERLEEALG